MTTKTANNLHLFLLGASLLASSMIFIAGTDALEHQYGAFSFLACVSAACAVALAIAGSLAMHEAGR